MKTPERFKELARRMVDELADDATWHDLAETAAERSAAERSAMEMQALLEPMDQDTLLE